MAETELRVKLGRRRVPRLQELGLVVVIVLLYVPLSIAGFRLAPEGTWNLFLGADNQFNGIGTSMSVYAIMSIGMTCVIVAGGIDISVGSILGFSELAGASALQWMPAHAPWYAVLPVAFLAPMVVGGLWGLVNGAITVGLRMHPFIVTLGTLGIIRGLTVLWFPSTVPTAGRGLPEVFGAVRNYEFPLNLRLVPVIPMVVVFVLGFLFLHMLVAGRETYAVGGNAEAARYSGIRVWWVTVRVYVLMGICCGVAATVELLRFGASETAAGQGYELMVIAAAVVGGAALTGGRGTAFGAVLGAMVIAVIENGIVTLGWNQAYTKVIVGSSIIVTVAIDTLVTNLSRRRGAGAASG